MPAIQKGLVLVTGASGFLGTNTVSALLKEGYTVRATVRSKDKGEYVKSLYPSITYVVIEEMGAPGAYDEAVKDVQAVIHIASPMESATTGDGSSITRPAVEGVQHLLASIATHGLSVKRVVLISSILSTAPVAGPPGERVTEDRWNEEEVALLKKEGVNGFAHRAYTVSKVLSEQAFWEYLKHNRAFDGVALRPSVLMGPPTQFDSSAALSNPMATVAWAVPYSLPGIDQAGLDKNIPMLVDVRDCALAVVRALQVPAAGGQAFHISGGPLHGNDLAIAASKVFPDRELNPGNSDPAYIAKLDAGTFVWDASKSTRAFGLQYRAREETLGDMFRAFKDIPA